MNADNPRRRRQGFALIAAGLVAGVVAAWILTAALGAASTPAPVPTSAVVADPSQAPVGPTQATVTGPGQSATVVTADAMGVSQLFIPSLAVYAPLVPVSGAHHEMAPPFPVSSVGISTTGADPTATQGTVLVAGHVTDGSVRGALYPLSTIQAGARAYLTGSDKTRTDWQLESLTSYVKADLPDSIWDTTGQHRLVVVTCSGPVAMVTNKDGTKARVYRDNLVAVFTPTHEHSPAGMTR